MLKWSDCDALIPAVMSMTERADSVRQLLIDIGRQCPGMRVRIMPQWRVEEPESWREVFATISAGLEDLSRPWLLYFEDDAQLGPEFGDRVLPILDAADDDCGAVSFFSDNQRDLKRMLQKTQLYESGYPFVHAQGLAIKREVAAAWGKMMVSWWDRSKEKKAPDMALGDCCRDLGLKIMVHLPSLVQHRDIPSAFGHTHCPKSKTFNGIDQFLVGDIWH